MSSSRFVTFVALAGTLVWACNSDDDPRVSATTSGGAKSAAGAPATHGNGVGGAVEAGGGTSKGGSMIDAAGTAGTAAGSSSSESAGGSSVAGDGNEALGVSVAPGVAAGAAVVNVAGSAPIGAGTVSGYSVVADPGAISVTGATMPITVVGLAAGTDYSFTVVVHYASGSTRSATSGKLAFYDVVETFCEPMTQPNDTIFTGAFSYDVDRGVVTNLAGSLTQSMTKVSGVFGPPMTVVSLEHQLSAVPTSIGGADGLLVTTFALATTDTFTGGGFGPGGTQYFGLSEGTPNNHNAYAMVFIHRPDPTLVLGQAQLDKLAYADCTSGGMMMSTCMTGTTVAGYGRAGTMGGYPISQVITRR